MKKFFLLAVAFVTWLSVMAQQKADEVIRFSAKQYDFGKIKQGVPVTTYFTITNTSEKPIVIENVSTGCGCTTPEYPKEPIPAGASSKMKVRYNAAAMRHFEKDVTIKLAGINETKVVKITGEVVDANSVAGITNGDTKTTTAVVETKTVTKAAGTKTKTKKA